MKNHYVYKLVDVSSGEYYYGSRSCNSPAVDDVKYMGSYKIWKPNKNNLVKIILKENFSNRQEAINYESHLIKDSINDDKNKNYHIPSTDKFITTGFVTCYDLLYNVYCNVSVDDYYSNKDRYISNAKMHGSGSGNSQYNTMWINNGIEQIKINKNIPIPYGYVKGTLKYIWIYDTANFKNTRILEGTPIPDGYIKGKYLKPEVKEKLSKLTKGISLSDTTKKKMSESKKGSGDVNFGIKMKSIHTGKTLTESHKDKISASMKAKWAGKNK